MPQQYDFSDDDDFEDDEAPANTGDNLVKQLRKQIKERDKKIAEYGEKLSGFEKVHRERTVAEVLTASGVNPKVAKLIPSDVEASPDAVKKWVTDYADVFNIQVAESAPAVEAGPVVENAPAYDRMRAAEQGGVPAGADVLASKLAAAGNQAEFNAILAANGQSIS